MRRHLPLVALIAALSLMTAHADAAPVAAQHLRAISRTQVIQGFAVTLRWAMRAREAGAADYVAARGNTFLLVDIQIKRAGSRGTYFADPQDFHIQTSRGDIVDSEEFGMSHELTARNVSRKPIEGVIGFEVPANDRRLLLLWQPIFNSNPDAQAEWSIAPPLKSTPYYQ